MNFIASPAAAFGLSAVCMLSSYIAGNIKNGKSIPQTETSAWVCCSIVGILLLFLTNGPLPIPPQAFIVIILLASCSLCSGSWLVYTSFK